MSSRPTLWAVVLLGIGMATASFAGDLVMSQSNNPKAALNDRVAMMLGAERDGFSDVSTTKMKQLVTQPTRRNLWFRKTDPAEVRYDAAYVDALPAASGGDSWHCLAEALYFEARGESVEGIFAVGEVILNRVRSEAFPDDICDVIYQGTGELFRCQFTYSCDGKKEVINEPAAWKRVGKVADLLISGAVPGDLTEGATYYHTKAVKPRWSQVFTRTATIGYHYFYRKDTRLASN
jgi:hypothetical protein